MKVKHLFLAAALPMAFAACTNDELAPTTNGVIGNDHLGKLIATPLLGVGVGNEAGTKVYQNGSWQWLPSYDIAETKILDVDRIGLCWTGVNNNPEGYEGPAKETGDMVYTNVKFEHVGWLYENETAPDLHCGELINGEFHAWDNSLTPQATDVQNGTWSATVAGKTLNMATGMFKSGNGTIYEGEYIVYFPYNDSFWNAPVTAKQERLLDLTVNSNDVNPYELMSKHAFNVGYKAAINGGDEACEFSTRILTSGINFNLSGTGNVKEIVLWSKGETAFITSQALSAKKIKEAWPNLSDAIYMDDANNAASSTMVVRMVDNTGIAANLAMTNSPSFYLPILPTNIKDLHILIVNKNGETADLAFWNTGLDFEANAPKNLYLEINDGEVVYNDKNGVEQGEADFTEKNYAYDEPSFVAAYKKAQTAAANQEVDPRTVTLLDNITLTKHEGGAYNAQTTYPVIVESDPTLVDSKNTLTLAHSNGAGVNYTFRSTTFDVDVETVPQGCCNNGLVNLQLRDAQTMAGTTVTVYGGKLTLNNSVSFDGDVKSVFEPMDEEGELHPDRVPEVIISELQGANAVVNTTANFLNEGKMTINVKQQLNLTGATLTNKGDINVAGNGNNAENAEINMTDNASVVNEGDIYNMGDIDNNRGSFTNKEGATFTDYVGSSLSGNRLVNEGGDFICEVNSVVRYNAAIDLDGVRPTTIVRFVYGTDKNIGTGDFTTTYTLVPNTNGGIYVPYDESTLVKFESAIDADNTTTSTLILNNDANATAVKIGDLTVKSGKITISHKALTIDGDYTTDGAANTYLPNGITVTGDMNLKEVKADNSQGTVYTDENAVVSVGGDIIVTSVADEVLFKKGTEVTASNLTVAAGQTVTFQANVVANIDKVGEGVVTNNGTIDIINTVSGSDVPAIVWCNDRQGNGSYPNGRPQYHNN